MRAEAVDDLDLLVEDRHAAPGDAVQVRVIGNQWWWSFEYPELGFTTANELHVPLDETADPSSVYMQLESADVAHSFWVPRLAGKTDLIPNRINTMWFTPNATGVYYGQCAEYCGTQHSKMLLRVIVETPSEFAAWVENEKKPAVNDPAVADLIEEVRRVWGQRVLVDLAIAVAAVRVFPTLKRGLGHGLSCSLVAVRVP